MTLQPPQLAPGEVLPLARRLAFWGSPAALFDALTGGARDARDAVLLESADDSAGTGGRSLLAVRSALRMTCRGDTVRCAALTPGGAALLDVLQGAFAERLGPVRRLRAAQNGFETLEVTVPARPRCETDAERIRAPSSLDALRAVRETLRPRSQPATPAFYLVGCFAYDLIDAFESLPPARRDPHGFPDWVFWLPELEVRVDHRHGTAAVVAHAFGGGGPALYHDAVAALERAVAACERAATGRASAQTTSPARSGAAHRLPAPAPPESAAPTVDLEDAAYCEVVTRLQGHIAAGDVFQIVPSREFARPCDDPFAAYVRLRQGNPSPYLFYLRHPEWTLLGASPETSVKVLPDPEGPTLTLKPIAGTRPRGRTPEGDLDPDLDTRLEAELRQDAKEQAEHLMLVDLARNDVARVSVPGTRQVASLLTVERYSHVMHLVSTVTGCLQPDLDALHAYAACLNMGTLVGAPKIRATELLRAVEPCRRGPYGGAVGYLASDGSLDTAIVIRSALVHDGVAYVRAGAGVVHDSVPQAEAAETARKAEAVLRALDAASVGGATPPGDTP